MTAAQLRPGVRLGVDVGAVRIGTARSDPAGTLAVPIETIDRRRGEELAVARVAELAGEYEALEVVVGLPLTLQGDAGPAAAAALAFAAALEAALPGTPVRLVDERMTTVTAQRNLHAAGRTHRGSRSVIDQEAAAIVVEHALAIERATGRPAGRTVGEITT